MLGPMIGPASPSAAVPLPSHIKSYPHQLKYLAEDLVHGYLSVKPGHKYISRYDDVSIETL